MNTSHRTSASAIGVIKVSLAPLSLSSLCLPTSFSLSLCLCLPTSLSLSIPLSNHLSLFIYHTYISLTFPHTHILTPYPPHSLSPSPSLSLHYHHYNPPHTSPRHISVSSPSSRRRRRPSKEVHEADRIHRDGGAQRQALRTHRRAAPFGHGRDVL